jgi:hypothetical protein
MALNCTILHCTVLYYTVLYCTALNIHKGLFVRKLELDTRVFQNGSRSQKQLTSGVHINWWAVSSTQTNLY